MNTPFITHWTIKIAGNQSKTSQTKIRPTCLTKEDMTPKIGSKMAQNWQNGYIIQTKRARMLIFVAIPPFSYPGSSVMAFSGTYNNSLPKILGLGVTTGSTWGLPTESAFLGPCQTIAYPDFSANHYSAPFKTSKKPCYPFLYISSRPQKSTKGRVSVNGLHLGPSHRECIFGPMADHRIF